MRQLAASAWLDLAAAVLLMAVAVSRWRRGCLWATAGSTSSAPLTVRASPDLYVKASGSHGPDLIQINAARLANW